RRHPGRGAAVLARAARAAARLRKASNARLKRGACPADNPWRTGRAMLVLTRKLGEVIRVGDAVTVRVLEVRGNQVRLGVEAPADVRIYRDEVYRALQEEESAASRLQKQPPAYSLLRAAPPPRA